MTGRIDVGIVVNSEDTDHGKVLVDVLSGADEIMLWVAFLKVAGAQLLAPNFRKCLRGGGNVRAFIGTDFCLTHPDALRCLLKLSKPSERYQLHLVNAGRGTFHPKVYLARHRNRMKCVIGSANLTRGGMEKNEEASVLVECASTNKVISELREHLDKVEHDERSVPLDTISLRTYRDRFDLEDSLRRRALLEAESASPVPNLVQIHRWYERFTEDDNDVDAIKTRRSTRKQAAAVQNNIARLPATRRPTARTKDKLRTNMKMLMTRANWRLSSLVFQ